VGLIRTTHLFVFGRWCHIAWVPSSTASDHVCGGQKLFNEFDDFSRLLYKGSEKEEIFQRSWYLLVESTVLFMSQAQRRGDFIIDEVFSHCH
jgi:hypothetical protein